MNLGDLLDARVLAHDGEPLGHVVDVRFALELLAPDDAEERDEAGREHSEPDQRPLTEQVRRRDAVGSAELMGLLVSPHTGSSLLGYERAHMRGPWPIAAIVRARHRGTFLVRWRDVVGVEGSTVTLAPGFERLDPTLE